MELLLAALAEAIFTLLIEDLARRPGLAELREKLKGAAPEKIALQRALAVTYVTFARAYPSLTASFFDEHFLQRPEVIGELSKLLTPNQNADISKLEKVWQSQFATPPTIRLSQPLSCFLETLEGEIKAQPWFKPFTDSRAFDQLYAIAQRNEEQVAVQTQTRDLLVDIRSLLKGIVVSAHDADQNATDTQPINRTDIQDALIDVLLRIPAFLRKENRDILLFGLDEFATSLPRYDVAVTDIIHIVSSLTAIGQLENGEWPLAILMRNAQRYCSGNTELGRKLAALLARYQNS